MSEKRLTRREIVDAFYEPHPDRIYLDGHPNGSWTKDYASLQKTIDRVNEACEPPIRDKLKDME